MEHNIAKAVAGLLAEGSKLIGALTALVERTNAGGLTAAEADEILARSQRQTRVITRAAGQVGS